MLKLLTFVILLIGIQKEMTRKSFIFFKVQAYCQPRKDTIYERCLFFSINQETGESIDKYVIVSNNMTDNREFNQLKE